MNKKIFTLMFTALILVSCSSNKKIRPIKPNGDFNTSASSLSPKERDRVREKINLENTVFKKMNLPLPPNTFGQPIPYLVPVNDNHKEDFDVFEEYDEDKALKYFKNLKLRGHGDNSAYWRWKTSIKKDDLYDKIPNRIIAISKNNQKNVFTLANGEWKNIPISDIGTVKDIIVAARGESGIITHILIVTNKGKYLVAKEFNVRKLLATNTALHGSKGTENSYADKPITPTCTVLPSAYLALEEDGNYIHI